MQPYQRASEALRSGDEEPLHLLKNIGLTAVGGGAAAAGSRAVGKLIPAISSLINQYVPEKLSKAGLSKLDPRFGKFLDGALKEGYTYDELRNFLGEKVEKSNEEQNPKKASKGSGNIIEQYSPELHGFILEEIKKGRSPLEAGSLATLKSYSNKDFKKVIDKIVSDHKTPWASILSTVYGDQGNQSQNQPNQPQPEPNRSPGAGQQALMSILEKINQRFGQ